MTEPRVITAPIYEPVSVSQVRDHLRITHTDEDSTIELFIPYARELFERLIGRTMHEAELEVAMDMFPCERFIRLPRAAPLISVTHVKYVDSDGVENTWDPSSYVVDTYRMPGRIAPAYGQTWPTFTPYPLSAVRIRYKAGLANSNSPIQYPPSVFQQAILQMVGSAWENREAETVTDRATIESKMLTFGVLAVIANWPAND